jgi:two-component system, NtrC family, sensor kinase
MSEQSDTILIVDDDPEARGFLREQIFGADAFQVYEAKDGADALQMLAERRPDLIVLDWELAGLSGRDLLLGVKSQGFQGPVIVVAESGSGRAVIEAFRLGAADYVLRPVREAELLAAVERSLSQVRLRRQRDDLVNRLRAADEQNKARIGELTTLYDIGQSVTAMRDLEQLFERVLNGAVTVTRADHALLLLRDEKGEQLILRAGKNLPLAMLDRLGEPVENHLAELVMTSLEPLLLTGEGLRRFAAARGMYAVAYVPLMVQGKAIGVLAVGNHETDAAFDVGHGRMLKALADYASIAIVNARLFSMLEERAQTMETALHEIRERDAQRGRQLQAVLSRLHQPLVDLEADLARAAEGKAGRLSKDARKHLHALDQRLRQLVSMITKLQQNTD